MYYFVLCYIHSIVQMTIKCQRIILTNADKIVSISSFSTKTMIHPDPNNAHAQRLPVSYCASRIHFQIIENICVSIVDSQGEVVRSSWKQILPFL